MPIIRDSDRITSAWSERFAADPVAVLYKHSPTCGLSDIAMGEVRAFLAEHPDVPVYLVDVFTLRPLSNAVEAALGVRHESPQTLVFRAGALVWHGSHRRVTAAALRDAVAEASAGAGAGAPVA
jgi:bacillithiol system protein YtxJ